MTLMTKDSILDETAGLESIWASPNYQKDLRIAVSVKSAYVQKQNLRNINDILWKYGSQKGNSIFRPENNEVIFIYHNSDSALKAYESINRDVLELRDAAVDIFTENEAIERQNGALGDRSTVRENPTDPRIRSSSYERPNRRDCLYMQGLIGSVNEEKIRNDLLEDFGDILELWLSRLKKHCFVYVIIFL